MKLRKVPIEELLTILEDLYEKGVDYIDISGFSSGDNNDEQDVIKISIRPEYMSKEKKDEEEDNYNAEDKNPANINLSENDFDDLI